MSNENEVAKQVARILRLLAGKIEENQDFLKDIGIGIRDIPLISRKKKVDEPVNIDIFHVFTEEGESVLRQKLDILELRDLKRIIRQHGFDPSKLAEKWKTKQRLVDLVVERVIARSDKGKVFKDYPGENHYTSHR